MVRPQEQAMQYMQYGWRSRRLRLLAIGANDLHIMQDDSLPMPLANYDPIRNGLRNLKADASSVHPIEQAQRKVNRRMALSMHLYPHDEAAELLLYLHQVVCSDGHPNLKVAGCSESSPGTELCRRRLGLPSSNIGLDALMGRLDDFSTESYLGLPETNIDMPDFRTEIEKQRGINIKRGIS